MKNLLLMLCLLFVARLPAEIKILALAGSTKQGSFNVRLMEEAAKIARQLNAEVTVIHLQDFSIPLYSEDLEKKMGMPNDVKRLRKLFINSDAIIISSPEYNASIPALLKNLLDWASRTEEGQGSREAFKDKQFAIMSASPGGGGGARGLKHLQTIIEALGGKVISLQVSVANAHDAFDEKNQLKNEEIKKALKNEIEQLISIDK